MENPLVSILIPMLNVEKYIDETLKSLLKQTYLNIEIILVDDGSTDNSLTIAKNFEKEHENITVYTQENCGAQVARNKAFKLSKGDYIQYFDADDVMHKDKISSQIDKLRINGFRKDIVATGKFLTFNNSISNAEYHNQIINKNYEDNSLYFKEAWENGKFLIGQVWLIPRKLNKVVGEWNINLRKNQDGEFFMRVAHKSTKIIFVENSIVYYRIGIDTNISQDFSISALRSHLDSYHIYFDTVKKDLKYGQLKKGLALLYSLFYINHYPLNNEMKKEVYLKLNELGYSKPITKFDNIIFNQLASILGIDNILILRNIKNKFSKYYNNV